MKRKLFAIIMSAVAVLCMFSGFSLAETVNTSADLLKNKKTEAYLYSRPMFQTAYRLGVEHDKTFGLQSNCLLQYKVKPFSMIVKATNKEVVAVVKLKSKIETHKANLTDDYQMLKAFYEGRKKQEFINKWIVKKQKETYISIDPAWQNCSFQYPGWIKK